MLEQITIKLIKSKLFHEVAGCQVTRPRDYTKCWDHQENRKYLAWKGSGQFFVCFVIHLQTKLELFILQQNAVLFSTARFLWQVIAHQEAECCEIKIQLSLKFRWHNLFYVFFPCLKPSSSVGYDCIELQWREGSKGQGCHCRMLRHCDSALS